MKTTHTTPDYPARVYLSDADITRVVNEPIDPADPHHIPPWVVSVTWITILSISAALFMAGCWGIYQLFN